MKKQGLILKSIIFFLVGTLFGNIIQNLLSSSPFEGETRDDGYLRAFYQEDDPVDVLVVGTSHMLYGVSPMEIYDKYKITTYNLASAGQPIQVSYFILKEAIKYQIPEVIVLDVSSLWAVGEDYAWRYILDKMPLSKNKINFAREYIMQNDKNSFLGAVFPCIRYHDRWKYISKSDFTSLFSNHRHYCKGYNMDAQSSPINITENEMNSEAEKMSQIQKNTMSGYRYETYWMNVSDSTLYDVSIPKENLEWLFRVRQLCTDHNIELLLTKIPVINLPTKYSSAWTEKRAMEIRRICSRYNIAFWDIQYDSNINLDLSKDYRDLGHLNLSGAQKVSNCLGKYLIEKYNVSSYENTNWNYDLFLYRQVTNVALLQLENDFIKYVNKLKEMYLDKNIIIVVKDDMYTRLSEKEKEAFYSLGIKIKDFIPYQDAFLAIIENGEVIYQGRSNQKIIYEGKFLKTGYEYQVLSSGYYAKSQASVVINNMEYAMNMRGINIIVYDDYVGEVIDSVYFDTFNELHKGIRTWETMNIFLKKYENFLLKNMGNKVN